MLESMHIGATGMHAQQRYVDVIANNLANVNTTGYKRSRVSFEDLMYRELANANGVGTSGADAIGVGSAVTGVRKDFTGGEAKRTDRPLDLAIIGQGFLEVVLPDGSYGYTRTGSLQVTPDGLLATADGNALNPAIRIPADAENVVVSTDGLVSVKVPDQARLVEVGQIELGRFMNEAGLKAAGGNIYQPTDRSGDVFYARPGHDGVGTLQQGYVEASNVDLVEELTTLILAQRAYEINSKVVQASDDMLGIINNLRR